MTDGFNRWAGANFSIAEASMSDPMNEERIDAAVVIEKMMIDASFVNRTREAK